MSSVKSITAWEILDSRGHPTLRAQVVLNSGSSGAAAAPAGASTGRLEARELRDGDPDRFGGRGVLKAIDNVNRAIAAALAGHDANDQAGMDNRMRELDGSPAKERLGANAIVAVSLAVARAAAADAGLPLYGYLSGGRKLALPVPCFNVLNGGQHAPGGVDFQEFMIVPLGAPSLPEGVRWASEVYHALGGLLHEHGQSTAVGDEGGFAPRLARNEEALELLVQAIEKAGYRPGEQLAIALDPAASGLYQDGRYELPREGSSLGSGDMVDRYESWIQRYPVCSIEDGLAEDDWEGWTELNRRLGSRVQLVGDDIFVTNPELIQRGIDQGIANAVLIKPNQIGTLTETRQAVDLAHRAGWRTMISHRSGETDDSTIADLAVGLNIPQIKSGAPARGERVAKYNRLLEIARELSTETTYAGAAAFARATFATGARQGQP
ncbi:MAG: phosphopyruvate hydratase [Chloroflexota bacterium]